jgi:hypothetical protein
MIYPLRRSSPYLVHAKNAAKNSKDNVMKSYGFHRTICRITTFMRDESGDKIKIEAEIEKSY